MWCAVARFGGIRLHIQLLFHCLPCILICYNYFYSLVLKALGTKHVTLFGHETPVKVYHVIGKTSDKYTVRSEIPFYIMSYEIVTVYPCTSNVVCSGKVWQKAWYKRLQILNV